MKKKKVQLNNDAKLVEQDYVRANL